MDTYIPLTLNPLFCIILPLRFCPHVALSAVEDADVARRIFQSKLCSFITALETFVIM
jgi:hypothetical protein